jgi:hypothetical protein
MKMQLIAVAALAAMMMAAPAAQAQTEAQPQAQPQAGPQVMLQPATPPDPATAQQERVLRARDNLVALRQGRISVADLTPQEQQDVLDLDRMARGEGADNRSFQQQCIDAEVARIKGRPSRLAWEVIRLKCK